MVYLAGAVPPVHFVYDVINLPSSVSWYPSCPKPFEKADKNGNVRFLSTYWTLVSDSVSLLLMHRSVLIYSFDVYLYP